MKDSRQMTLDGIRTFSDDMDFFFDHIFRPRRPVMMPSEDAWHPPIDVLETEEEYIIIVEIAGIRQEDVRLSLEANQLTIHGIRREIDYGEQRHYHIMEVDVGPFERNIKLPKDVDREKITAVYKDGFLDVRLKKLVEPSTRTITIEIET